MKEIVCVAVIDGNEEVFVPFDEVGRRTVVRDGRKVHGRLRADSSGTGEDSGDGPVDGRVFFFL